MSVRYYCIETTTYDFKKRRTRLTARPFIRGIDAVVNSVAFLAKGDAAEVNSTLKLSDIAAVTCAH